VHPPLDPISIEVREEIDASDPNWLIALSLVFEVGVGLLIVFYVRLL